MSHYLFTGTEKDWASRVIYTTIPNDITNHTVSKQLREISINITAQSREDVDEAIELLQVLKMSLRKEK